MRIKPPLYRTRVEVFLIDRKAIYIYLKEKIEQFEGEDVSYFYKDSYSIFFSFTHRSMPVIRGCLYFLERSSPPPQAA